jgi:hypothetical protein
MQTRLARSAYDALDIQAGAVSPEEVRAAFLGLTKIYHPAKFARMSPEIQKMANEVFLALRAAHDQLARPKNVATPKTNSIPIIPSKTPPPTIQTPPNAIPARTQPMPRANQPPAPAAAITPPTQPRVSGPQSTQPLPRPNQPPAVTPAITPPTQPRPNVLKPPTPATGTNAVKPPVAPTRPSQPSSGLKRTVTPVGGVPIPTTGTTGSGPRPAVSTGNNNVEPELVGVYDQFAKGQWAAARATLNALIALQPKPRYQALLHYSEGREAQLAGQLNVARVELGMALEIDPDLQLAKTAQAELFTRRK